MGVQLKPSDYVHLHNHTHHSVLDGLTKIPDLINAVKEMGMEAVAITDHGTMSGAVEFYKAAKGADIKHISPRALGTTATLRRTRGAIT
jgi:DNA polymerase-3 subunit alpha